jgi:cytochrome c biogenesis factor
LVTRSELEEKMNAINDLKAKVEGLQQYNEMQVKLRDMTYKQKMNETTEKYASDLDSDKKRYGSLDSEKQNGN